MQKLFSIRKVAEILDVHIETLRRWDTDGKLKSIRTPGGHRRYTEEQINTFISQNNDNQNYSQGIQDTTQSQQ